MTVVGLESAPYVDKVDGGKSKTQAASSSVSISSETDRVYSPAQGAAQPVSVVEAGRTLFTVTRENLDDVVVWNPWADKARGMADFAPDAGFKNMLCVEPGSVSGFTKLEPGDAFEGSQSISYET